MSEANRESFLPKFVLFCHPELVEGQFSDENQIELTKNYH